MKQAKNFFIMIEKIVPTLKQLLEIVKEEK